jgi:hypothetical protein
MKRSAWLSIALIACLFAASGCASVPSASQPAPATSAASPPSPSFRFGALGPSVVGQTRFGQLQYKPANADAPEAGRTNPDHVICPNAEPCGP